MAIPLRTQAPTVSFTGGAGAAATATVGLAHLSTIIAIGDVQIEVFRLRAVSAPLSPQKNAFQDLNRNTKS